MLNTTDRIIKHKTGLLNLAEERGNVSKACQVMGMSRDTFYRYKSTVGTAGLRPCSNACSETRLWSSLRFLVAFIANVAR